MTPFDQNRIELLERRLREMENKLRGIPTPAAPDPGFWAHLKVATAISGANNRWKYDWEEIRWTLGASDLGYATWADARVGPYTAPIGSTGWAYNSTELDNTTTLAGSGWEDKTYALAPNLVLNAIQNVGKTQAGTAKFPIVWLRPYFIPVTGHWVYVFAGWNTPAFTAGGS